MTYEEAIAYIECGATAHCCCASNKKHGGDCDGEDAVNKALAIAIKALEKQIPQYPEYTDEYMDDAYCPACGKFEFEMGTTTWGMKYCPECGQAIDWGDWSEEDE